jgi:hypothetical protein
MPLMPGSWRRLHWTTRLAAVVGGVAGLLLLAPISAAVVMLRCCDSTHGASVGAWAVMGLLVILGALAAATATALAVATLRHLWLRANRRPAS